VLRFGYTYYITQREIPTTENAD